MKDWERLNRSGRYDMKALKAVILLLLANDGDLPPHYKDHALQWNWNNHRECYISGDFLLIYRPESDTALFVRAGTHSELFG